MNAAAQAQPTARSGAESLPRSRGRALLLAALTLWVPTLLPLLLGMLHDCMHCSEIYLAMLPVVPGVISGVLWNAQGAWFVVAAAVPTVFAFVALYAAAREMPRRWLHAVQGVVAVLLAFESIGFASALRV